MNSPLLNNDLPLIERKGQLFLQDLQTNEVFMNTMTMVQRQACLSGICMCSSCIAKRASIFFVRKCCVWLIPKTTMIALISCMSIIMVMTIAILVVNFAPPKPAGMSYR